MIPYIYKVDIIEEYKIQIYYKNGEIRIFDFFPYLKDKYYNKLNDYDYFKNFKIFYNTIKWNDELDIAPEILYEESILIENAKQV